MEGSLCVWFEWELTAFTLLAFSSFCAPWLYFSDVLSINLRKNGFFTIFVSYIKDFVFLIEWHIPSFSHTSSQDSQVWNVSV